MRNDHVRALGKQESYSTSSGLVSRQGGGITAFVEGCCGPKSVLSARAQEEGLVSIRMTSETHFLSSKEGDRKAQEDIEDLISQGHKVHLWGSVPCRPWCRWHSINWRRIGPKYRAKILQDRVKSIEIVKSFFGLEIGRAHV